MVTEVSSCRDGGPKLSEEMELELELELELEGESMHFSCDGSELSAGGGGVCVSGSGVGVPRSGVDASCSGSATLARRDGWSGVGSCGGRGPVKPLPLEPPESRGMSCGGGSMSIARLDSVSVGLAPRSTYRPEPRAVVASGGTMPGGAAVPWTTS